MDVKDPRAASTAGGVTSSERADMVRVRDVEPGMVFGQRTVLEVGLWLTTPSQTRAAVLTQCACGSAPQLITVGNLASSFKCRDHRSISTLLYGSTYQIPVGDMFALISAEDVELISERCWFKHVGPHNIYARSTRSPKILMHNLILPGGEVDHIDHDGLNNQRSNLRLATRRQNTGNMRPRRAPGTSVYKGVCWNKKCQKWRVLINSETGSRTHVGLFVSEIEAAHAYDEAARRIYGEFACVNFPLDG